MKIFLDDMREPCDVTWLPIPHTGWTIARNFEEFCGLLWSGEEIEAISFDHDLADVHYVGDYSERTGYHCALELVEFMLEGRQSQMPVWSIHSMNPVGADRIRGLLVNYEKFRLDI